MNERLTEIYRQLEQMKVRFVLDEVNRGWYFYNTLADKDSCTTLSEDGVIYRDKNAAINAAAVFYGIKNTKDRSYV